MNTIAIFGAPRSGTTWLGQLFNSSPNTLYRYQPLFSYEFKDYLSESNTKQNIKQFGAVSVKFLIAFVTPFMPRKILLCFSLRFSKAK